MGPVVNRLPLVRQDYLRRTDRTVRIASGNQTGSKEGCDRKEKSDVKA
jgi:hypothetical protein